MNQFSSVGRNLAAIDGKSKVTGLAQFTGDIKIKGMLVGKILHSPIAHANIRHIDTSQALKVPGVKAVVTYKDSPLVKFNSSNRFPSDWDFLPQDKLVLGRKVRHVGDRVAAVAAVDEDTAMEALSKIKVDYEELPAVFTPAEATRPGAPILHDFATYNIARKIEINVGDVEEGFRQADYIFENVYTTQAVQHMTLEPHICIAEATGSNIVIWSSTQVPFMLRQLISYIFKIPIGKIRVIKPNVGGAFGGKDEMFEEALAVLLSQKAGRPVKIEYSREEEFYCNRRHPSEVYLKTGVSKEGIITARYIKAITDTGAYATAGPKITFALGEKFAALYRTPNIKYEGFCVYTNTPPSGAFRGYGNPQSNFALESQMDEIAEKLGIDPLELRLRNHIRKGDIHPVAKTVIESCGLPECLQKGAERIGWEKRNDFSQTKASNNLVDRTRKKRGIGMACALHGSNLFPYGRELGSALVRVNEDGSIDLVLGAVDTGQGSNTIMAQIAAETLGVPIENINVTPLNTGFSPLDIGNTASRTTFMVGNAVQLAANKVKERLLEIAAEIIECEVSELRIKDGLIFQESCKENSVSIANVSHYARYNLLTTIAELSVYKPPHNAPPFAAVFAEVEVDLETGVVEILHLVSAQDVGRAINPLLIEGQMNGAMQIGIGLGMSEKLYIDRRNGRILNANLLDYGAFSPMDMPPVDIIIVESIEPQGPYGAKSVGEVGTVPVAAAIANAVYNAAGVRICDLPITPQKVLNAIKRSKV
jgi:xanthine dehydrogenase molybdenum-binding subunit